MDSDIWLPLATLVLGWAGAQVTELLRDRRTSTRDRLARRAELQRTTLLELQEALGGAWLAFLMSQLEEEELEGTGLAQVSQDFRPTRARVRLLASRVEDERVRELATALAEGGGWSQKSQGARRPFGSLARATRKRSLGSASCCGSATRRQARRSPARWRGLRQMQDGEAYPWTRAWRTCSACAPASLFAGIASAERQPHAHTLK
jgi:hypothetical protein